jgi:hypothetical protein
MKIKTQGNSVRFIFKGAGQRSEALLLIQACIFGGTGLLLLYAAFRTFADCRYTLTGFCLLTGGGFSYMGWRIMARTTRREQLWVSPESLTLVTTVNGKRSNRVCPVEEVLNLCYVGIGATTTHHLASENLDPLGFNARQAIVDSVSAAGNLAFYHNGKMIRFGTGVPSWDVEIIDRNLREKTGDSLSIAGLPEEIPEHLWNT